MTNSLGKLISIKDWVKLKFVTNGGPSIVTVRRWCRENTIACERIGGKWFIYSNADAAQFETTNNPAANEMITRLSQQL